MPKVPGEMQGPVMLHLCHQEPRFGSSACQHWILAHGNASILLFTAKTPLLHWLPAWPPLPTPTYTPLHSLHLLHRESLPTLLLLLPQPLAQCRTCLVPLLFAPLPCMTSLPSVRYSCRPLGIGPAPSPSLPTLPGKPQACHLPPLQIMSIVAWIWLHLMLVIAITCFTLTAMMALLAHHLWPVPATFRLGSTGPSWGASHLGEPPGPSLPPTTLNVA